MNNKFFIVALLFISINLFSEGKSINVFVMNENIYTETVYENNGGIKETKVIKKGENPLTIQILELIELKLISKGYIIGEVDGSDYNIKILPNYTLVNVAEREQLIGNVYDFKYIHCYSSSILVKIFDKNSNLLGYEVFTGVKRPESFSNYISDKIVKYILNNYN